MQITSLAREHLEAAAKLAAAAHSEERTHAPSLPLRDAAHYLPLFQKAIERGPGGAALDESGRLVGYIIGMKVPNFRGTQNGIHVPEWASAAVGQDRFTLIRRLYEFISDKWVENGCFTHAVTLYAHDEVALNTWFRSAFGMICGDGVRELVPVNGQMAEGVDIRQASVADIDLFLPLVHEHQRYYPSAPLFMPLFALDSRDHYMEWLSKPERNFWLALDQGQPIGYFESSGSHPGASHLIEDPGTCSVCGAFVKPGIRQQGVGAALLNRVVEWAALNGYERCAVDWESHNIYGSRFWEKHFRPVAYSVMRKVDERVAWAHSGRNPKSIW